MSANKSKPSNTAGPKLAPRPTAASTARAARNATNRNLNNFQTQKSPSRLPVSNIKGKNLTHNNVQRSDSKISIKSNLTLGADYERMTLEHIPKQPSNQPSFVNDNNESTILIIEDKMGSENDPQETTELTKQDINSQEIVSVVSNETNIPHENYNSSRPQTPKNQLLSRPQTPKLSSRPTTPASHTATPLRQASAHSRPRTPAHTLSQQLRTSPSVAPANLTAAFTNKQKEFLKMKKELDMKQQLVLEVFEGLREIKERLSSEGVTLGDNVVQKELVVFNVADWSAEEIMQLCRDADAASSASGAVEIFDNTPAADDQYLDDFSGQIIDIPAHFADICIQALNTRQEIIGLVKDNMSHNDKDLGEALEKIEAFNSHGLKLCEVLREQKVRADATIISATNFLRKALQERNALLGAGESLIREISKLKTDLDVQNKRILSIQDGGEGAAIKALEEARRDLEEEKQAKAALKEKLSVSESQLRATRLRITKMDRQLREAEASIGSLTGTVKTLEDQSRQREVQLEARARKLRESLKTGELSNSQLAQQRDVLQAEIQELKEAIAKMTVQHKQNLNDMTEQLNSQKKSLEEQKQQLEKELLLKNEMQEALNDSRSQVETLNAKITEIENCKPNPELPSEREMDLWAELQATKETLRMTEEEMNLCKREKMRFIDTLSKITESDNKIGMQQKLASELMGKEELIGKMQLQIRELTKNTKLNEQKVMQYEQYVRNLQAHSQSIHSNKDTENGVSYQDLQQEVMNLHMNLLEAAHRNEELQEILMQKDQQIEQQDKTSRSQATVIKVREELINMLKSKETQQSRELTALQHDLEHRMKIVEDVNKQIAAKADEIQELFATLEMKQQQIHRLEKIIVALEEQQRRAQTQRLRNEEKIAALEHELASGGGKRERRFILF